MEIKYIKMEYHKRELAEKGYTIFRNVLRKEEIKEYKDEFNKWMDSVPDLRELHNRIDFNGIFKFFEVGNQRFAWLVRTNSKILNIFKELWETDELVTSFDGCCYYPKDFICPEKYWTHTDQSSRKKGVHCYQSFVSMTDNKERTLLVYEGSNLEHENYFKEMNIDCENDWNIIDKSYIYKLYNNHKFLDVKAGDLVVWESRTFHQNLCNSDEERLVQYLCYLPKNRDGNNEFENNNRKKYFEERRTTSHWPYPMNVVPKQPLTYNYYNPEDEIFIEYDKLPKPNLDDLMEKISELL
tara:strand:- start:2760 stop:3650 length:891 start_codon:yes stop_codon:yes gene_type:complete